MSEPSNSVRVANAELATVRDAMRELNRLLAALEAGKVEKIVLTQRNQMRAVLVTVERYSQLEGYAANTHTPIPPPRPPEAPPSVGHPEIRGGLGILNK